MRVRIFGGSKCKDCLGLLVLLDKYGVDYEHIDALADETQDLCDAHNVQELPHIQFIEDDTIIITHRGAYNEEELVKCLSIYFPNY